MSETPPRPPAADDAQQRFQAIFEQAAVGLGRIAPDGHWLEANPRLCEITGYPLAELLTLTFTAITHPEDRPADQLALAQLLAPEGGSINREKRYLRPDGSSLWVQVSASLVRQADGRPAYIIAVVQDIDLRKRALEALELSERRLRAVIETSLDGFMVADLEGRVLEVNDVYCNRSGYSRTELLGRTIQTLEGQESPEQIALHLQQLYRQGGGVFETLHRQQNGTTWPVEVSVTYSDIEGGRLFAFIRDITERYMRQALIELDQQLAELGHNASVEALMRAALDRAEALTQSRIGFFHFVDPDQESLSLQVWSSNTLSTFCFAEGHGRHYPIAEAGVWVDCIHQRRPVIHNDYASLPHRKGLPEGHAQVLRELTVPLFRHGLIVGVLGVGNKPVAYSQADIERVQQIGDLVFDRIEHKRTADQVQYLAFYDPLTGLPNRSLLFDRLGQALAQTRRLGGQLAVAYLDLDGFKPINDRHGHANGDRLLQMVADRLKGSVREMDTVARLGGDEFVLVLLGQAQSRHCEGVIARIQQALRQPFFLGRLEVRISASIGYTLFPLDEADPDLLLRHADQAMYQAKSSGKDAYRLYSGAEHQRVAQRQLTLEQVDLGLAQAQFQLHFQPQVNLLNGELVGVEALLRWHHPHYGRLLPEAFLSLIEGSEQERRLDDWVMRNALAQIAQWQAQGRHIPIGVNLGAAHLRHPGFLDSVRALSADFPRPVTSQLQLELREATLHQDAARLTPSLEGAAELGIQLVLDGFGTDPTQMTYLQHLPVDQVKVDRQLLHSLPEHPEQLTTLEGLVALARQNRAPLVAVGVDSLDLAALLLDLGCHLAQGHAIAHAMSGEGLLAWYQSWPQEGFRTLLSSEAEGPGDALLRVARRQHQSWADGVEHYLRSEPLGRSPNLSPEQSHFHHWYNGLGALRYARRPGFAFLAGHHQVLYQQARELVGLRTTRTTAELVEPLAAFAQQRDEFLTRLDRLASE